MGLFGPKVDIEKIKEECEIFKTADFSDEKNDKLLDRLEDIIELSQYCTYFSSSENKRFNMETRIKKYYAFKNFFINIAGKDFADWYMGDDNFDITNEEETRYKTSKAERLLSAWKLQEAIKEDNIFRLVISNPSIRKGEDDGKSVGDPFLKRYNFYCNDYIDKTQANDPDSVVFDNNLFSYPRKDDEICEILEIDRAMADDKVARRHVLYNDEGELRRIDRIRGDYERYLETK